MKRIAIVGATGYIGRSLACEVARAMKTSEEVGALYLFSRSKEKLVRIVASIPEVAECSGVNLHVLGDFSSHEYDVIINCTGISDVALLADDPQRIITLTEEMDEMIISYLGGHKETLYINMSSGIVHSSIDRDKELMSASDYYTHAKKEAEKRHRGLSDLAIVDIRLFSFFSHLVDTDTHFLMSEIAQCIMTKKVFETNGDDIVRDYISPHDLYQLILCISGKETVNDAYDAYSKEPVSKVKLLEFLKEAYGLEYSIKDGDIKKGISSSVYVPKDRRVEALGYTPTHTSLESIDTELRLLIAK
jgi:nucleoside-diphosphate-sugar epimerase